MRSGTIFLGLLALCGAGLWWGLHSLADNAAIESGVTGRCATVAGINGSHDMAVDYEGGRVFVAALDPNRDDARGAIHLVDPEDPLADTNWSDVSAGAPLAFVPRGIDYYEDEHYRRLFVVNEANKAVEIFDVDDDGALSHLFTVGERRLTNPINVAAVGPESFYVTNNNGVDPDSLLGRLQTRLGMGSGELMHFDSVIWKVAASGLGYPVGVAAAKDRSEIYVAEAASRSVKVFERASDVGMLEYKHALRVPAAPANMTVDADGAVWAAVLPKSGQLSGEETNGGERAPSAVMRLTGEGVAIAYVNDGAELSGAFTAARIGKLLMIGAPDEQKILLCDLPESAF